MLVELYLLWWWWAARRARALLWAWSPKARPRSAGPECGGKRRAAPPSPSRSGAVFFSSVSRSESSLAYRRRQQSFGSSITAVTTTRSGWMYEWKDAEWVAEGEGRKFCSVKLWSTRRFRLPVKTNNVTIKWLPRFKSLSVLCNTTLHFTMLHAFS